MLRRTGGVRILQLQSKDGMNRLTLTRVSALTSALDQMTTAPLPLVVAGNRKFFSVGADLGEIGALGALSAYEFSRAGQRLMDAIANFSAPTFAAICGYCMGGGLDLALACRFRIASPDAIFGHRGAALGLITGWGGTQRLPRLIGRAAATRMLLAAEKIDAQYALRSGLIDRLAKNPLRAALQFAQGRQDPE